MTKTGTFIRILITMATLAVLAVIAPTSADAAPGGPTGIYLKLDGIDGDSTVQGFEKQILLNSFQWGIANTAVKTATGAGVGKADFSHITLTKALDRASSKLLLSAANGANIATGTLTFIQNGTVYLTISLTNIQVVSEALSSGGDRPSESVALAYQKVKWEYSASSATGVATKFSGAWDIAQNKAM